MDRRTKTITIAIVSIIIISIVVYFHFRLKELELQSENKLKIKQPPFQNNQLPVLTLVNRDSLSEAISKIVDFKDFIENQDGYKLCWENGKIKKESDLQLLFRGMCLNTDSYVAKECNNGRGHADFIFSKGAEDVTVVELKKATNSKLKQNLKNQLNVYMLANKTTKGISVILAFTDKQLKKIDKILFELGLKDNPFIAIIDARIKISGSNIV